MRLGLVLLALLLPLAGAERWEVRYFYDQDDSSLSLNDLQFASPQRALAVGYLTEKGRNRPAALITSDAGRHWSLIKPPDVGLCLFFLNENVGWVVAKGGLYRLEEGGRTWKKLRAPPGLLCVYFADEMRGWVVGERKAVYYTEDGGASWNRVLAAEQPKTTPEYTVYAWITFADARHGLIAGWSRPPRRNDRPRLPDWMEPERAARRREVPTLSILLDTRDGGRTWTPSVTSMFGRITRIKLAPDGRGLGLVEFAESFQWPTEVFRLDWRTGSSQRVFRRADRAVTDMALAPGGVAYLVAIEPQGGKLRLPIPGKLKVLRSSDLLSWEEMEVDYRAFARRAVLAAGVAERPWVATDTGMLLELSGR